MRSQAPAARRADSGPASPAARRADSGPASSAVEEPAQAPGPPAAPKPLDVVKLKLGMTHLVHKRIDQAIKTFAEILQETPGDKQTTQWFHIAHARLRIKNNDDNGAVDHYQKALEADENNHEARKFVREHHSKKRLNSLPFGRYFVKKS
jgi:predicted negative regulator of RcsB-dependent stress response